MKYFNNLLEYRTPFGAGGSGMETLEKTPFMRFKKIFPIFSFNLNS